MKNKICILMILALNLLILLSPISYAHHREKNPYRDSYRYERPCDHCHCQENNTEEESLL